MGVCVCDSVGRLLDDFSLFFQVKEILQSTVHRCEFMVIKTLCIVLLHRVFITYVELNDSLVPRPHLLFA